MISSPCKQLVPEYLGRLEGEFATSVTERGCYITTPFLRPDGESIELAAETDLAGNVRITDMGDSLGYLYVNGLSLSGNLIADVRDICRQFRVRLEGSELVIAGESASDLGAGLHPLLQTVLSVTDLIQRRRPKARVIFDDDVESLVILSGVTYDAWFKVSGAHTKNTVRFHVDSGRNLLIQPLTAATEGAAFSWAERWAFRFNDIREAEASWDCVAILDDRGERSRVWSDRALSPLSEYSVMWSQRERLSETLVRV